MRNYSAGEGRRKETAVFTSFTLGFLVIANWMSSIPPAWFSSLKQFENWQKFGKIVSGQAHGSLYLLISTIIPIPSLTLPVAKRQPERYGHWPRDIEPMMHLLPTCKRSFVYNPGRRRGVSAYFQHGQMSLLHDFFLVLTTKNHVSASFF